MTEPEGAARRGWYYGWNIVAICILTRIATNGLASNALTLFLHDWSVDLNAPISQLQLPFLSMLVMCALVSPMVGIFSDKYPTRTLFGCGLAGMSVFYVLMSFA